MATMNTHDVVVPGIGVYSDVPVIEILVAVGDTIAVEDSLIVLESDKATMEVPSPEAGTVESIAVKLGDTVSEGDLILKLTVGDDGDSAAKGDKTDGDQREGAPAASEGEAAEPAGEKAPSQAPSEAPAAGSERAEAPAEEPPADGTPVYAGPGARRLAHELGVALGTVAGTGRKGRITKDDVSAAAEAGAKAPAAGAPVPGGPTPGGLPPWPDIDFAEFGPVETVPLSRIKRIAGPLLSRNWVTIPHVTQFDDADITDLEAFRKEVNAEHAAEGVKVTMVSLLMKASAATLRAFPDFNASLVGGDLVLKRYIHMGFAVDTPAGLMVPVIRDVDRKGLLEIARELTELSGLAREGRIGPDQMRGGSFTITSLGGIGGTAFTPIINAPEVAILGASRSAMRPVWDGEEFRPRLILPLSLSYDHRAIDGAAAARFTTHLCDVLSDARRMLL